MYSKIYVVDHWLDVVPSTSTFDEDLRENDFYIFIPREAYAYLCWPPMIIRINRPNN